MSDKTQTDPKEFNKARCIHASRLPEYRQPFGARPCASYVDIFFDTFKEASNVTFCYTYGLYNFTYHEEPMYSVSGLGRYHVNLMLPSLLQTSFQQPSSLQAFLPLPELPFSLPLQVLPRS